MFLKLKKSKRLISTFFILMVVGSIFLIKECFSQELEIIEIEEVTWSGTKIIEGQYVLDRSETLNISKGTKIIFKENSSLEVRRGTISAVGTEKEPIIITSESGEPNGYQILLNGSGGIYFKNVNISGGGKIAETDDDEEIVFSFFKKAQAEFIWKYGAITSLDGSFIVLDNCDIFNNEIGISISDMNDSSDYVQVNRCRFFDNDISVIAEDNENTFLDFQYNYWEEDNKEGLIYDNNSKSEKDFKDPVVIIPGIMGSAKKDGEWQIEPIFGTYDDLIGAFLAEGYVLEKDLFLFPYEWRDSNVNNAILLKDKIQEIKGETNSKMVDVVAHSMGGLLIREYLQSNYYAVDIDQLVTLGTPHQGSPKSYPMWESGTFKLDNLDFFGYIGDKIFQQEAEEQGFTSLFDYIQNRPIASVQELLPVYDYLYDKDLDQIRNYPDGYPENEFLVDLNEKIFYLAGVEFMNISGNKGDNSTIVSYNVINETIGDKWVHGYPDSFDALVGDRGIVYGVGDETVPLESANIANDYAVYNQEVDSTHSDLPTDAQQDVLEFLTGERPEEKVEDNSKIKSLLTYFVFSPIDIQIVLEDGKRIGTNFETGESINELESQGAYYTGNNTENEFITIPNYSEGKYQILTSGTDSGDFRIEVGSIKLTEEGEVQEEQIKEIQGTTSLNQTQNFDLQIGIVEEDQIEEETPTDDSEEEVVIDDDEDDDDEEDKDKNKKNKKKKNKREDKKIAHVNNVVQKPILKEEKEDGKEFAESKNEIKKEVKVENKKNQPKVAGEKNKKIQAKVIALMVLIGVVLLTLTWTIKKKKVKVGRENK